MDDHCSICGTAYGSGRDAEGRLWRTLCRCERGFRCARGGHGATHVREEEGGETQYLCDKHGVPLETRAEQALLPAEPALPTPRAPTTTKPKPAKKPPSAPPPRGFSPAELATVFANYAEPVRCQCGDEHPFNTRVWREGEFIETNATSMFGRGFRPAQHHCPKCDLPNVHPDTGLATFSNVKASAPVVHAPATKGKR